ncbi:hypothetical protein [Salinispora oceanensis]|uniref:hypothetical protein n=1 Tax=Salinispora oceanensis TaxID=1050199 RepID=UPI0003A325A9|nr:hypothetical protein [Salinispora oceanensis]
MDQIEIERRSVPTATVLFYLNLPGAAQIPAGSAGGAGVSRLLEAVQPQATGAGVTQVVPLTG